MVSSACDELLDTWIDRAGLDRGYVLLQCLQDQYLPKPLSSKAHRMIYRALAARAGFSKAAVARIGTPFDASGGDQDRVRHGYSLAQIMRRENWSSSEMVDRYTEATALKPVF